MKVWNVYGTYKGERVRVTVEARTYGMAYVKALNAYPELIAERAIRVYLLA